MAKNLLETIDELMPSLFLYRELVKVLLIPGMGAVDMIEYDAFKRELLSVMPHYSLLNELSKEEFQLIPSLLWYMRAVATNMKTHPGFLFPPEGEMTFAQWAAKLEVHQWDFTHWLLPRCRAWFFKN